MGVKPYKYSREENSAAKGYNSSTRIPCCNVENLRTLTARRVMGCMKLSRNS